MGTSTIILVLVGNFIFEPAISAAIDYEPIHITVNENYNTQPGYGSQGLQSPDTAIVHQGANFYFKPQLNIRPNFIPSHIEALMSVLTQHPNSCSKNDSKLTVDKDKLIEILKPFMHVQNQNNIPAPEVMVDGPVLPPLALADVLSATGEDVKLEEQSISHKPASTFPQIPEILAKPEITVINTEHKPIIADFSAIPEAPVLPPLVLDNIPSTIGQEIKLEEQLFSQPPTEIYPTIPEILSKPEITIINTENKPITSEFSIIPEAPILPPLVLENIASVIGEEVKSENQLISEKNTGSYPAISVLPSLPEAIAVHTELKPVSSESAIIPEAPVLPPLVFNNIPSAIVEEIKLEEQSNSEKHTGVYPTISVIPSQPIEVHSDTKPFTPEFPIIPDAPVLPPLALDDIPSANGEDINLEEQLITQKPISVFPEVSELLAKPEITVINTEPKPITAEFSTIPEAPVLPPLALDKIPFSIGEEVKLEEQLISEKNTGMHTSISGPPFEPTAIHSESNYFTPGFPIIPEAPLLPPPPVLPPLVLDNRPSAISEDIKMEEQLISEAATSVYPTIPELPALPNPIAINTEPKPFISEFSAIPEAPVLPPLVIDDIPAYIGEEIKLEEQLISEAPTSVYPTIPEIPTKPEITVINTENKPIIPELAAIPEAPVLPPLVLADLPSTFGDGEILEEQIISDNPTSVFPKLPELLVKPQITVINTENKPITPALPAIPEAPVLPPLILNNIQSAMSEEVKMEEHLISAEHTTEPKMPEILSEPAIAVINTENKPITPELSAIPEAPVLPPLVIDDIPAYIGEEIKLEEQLISEAASGVYPTISEILTKPEITVISTENKPITPELSAIPEAPVLPPLILNNIQSAINEEVKMEEHLISAEHTAEPKIPEIVSEPAIAVINTENKPITPELSAIPEAPVLPPLVIDDIPAYIGEEIKFEEQLISEAASGVYPTISEILTKPEITVISTENKPITPELSAIPEAPVLPPLILNNIQSAINEEVKMEEHLISAEHTAEPKIPEIVSEPAIAVINTENKPITPELSEIPEAPVLPPLVINDIPAYIGEEIKLEEQLISEAASGVYPTIPEILTKPEITVINTENKPITPELSAIPEAPVLPPLVLDNIPADIGEEFKVEEKNISKEHSGVYPTLPEILTKPEITVINTENKPITPELLAIPEAPVLPPLVLDNIPADIGEEFKVEEQIISKEHAGVYPTISEILTKPEITVITTETKPITPELSAIPEAPVLPPLVINDIPAYIGEEIKFEEQLISEAASGVYPTISEILTKPEITVISTENKPITPELSAIPEAPVLPPLILNNIQSAINEEVKMEEHLISAEHTAEPKIPEIVSEPAIAVINTENKPITPELSEIPEAPVLPPLVINDIPAYIGEEIKLEEQLISEAASGVYPTIPEILTKPEITVNNTENKPITPELSAIPEAPVLPPLVLDNIPADIGEEFKVEEKNISKEHSGVYPTLPEILTKPEITVINTENKPITPELLAIPEAPVLPPLVLDNIPADIGEEFKVEEQIISKEHAGVYPTISEILTKPEITVITTETKPITPELSAIPEAPVLPPLVLENIPSTIGEVKLEEPLTLGQNTEIIINNEDKVESPDATMIPEAPQLSPFSWSNGRPDFREIELEETIEFEKSIQEISRKPVAASDKVDSFELMKSTSSPKITKNEEPAQLGLEELKEVFSIRTPQFSDSFVLKEVSRPNRYNVGRDIVIKKTPSSAIISRPGSRQGIFSFAPFISPFSQRVLKKKVMIPKSASLEHFLLKKHPFTLPIVPSPKLTIKAKRLPKSGKKNQFLYSTSCAQNIVKERIAPSMFLNKLRKYINFK